MADVSGISAQTSIFGQEPLKPLEGTNNNAFGQDAFLKLLVSQLRFQDPSEPVDNEAFLGQMAQFTGVEQMVKLNKSLEKLSGSSTKGDAVALLGAEVTVHPSDQILAEGQTPLEITGQVTQVRFEGSQAKLKVNGIEYLMDDVTKVTVPGLQE